MSTLVHPDDLLAMYALGALPEGERAEVEQHLRSCARCREAAAELQASVAILPYAVEPVAPSARLKDNLFARVDADLAQQPAAMARPAPAPTPVPARESLLETLGRLLRGWAPAVALAGLLLAAVLGQRVWALQNELARQRAEVAILSHPNLQTAELPTAPSAPPGAQARLFAAPDQPSALLAVNGLEPLAADQTYEFWLIRDGQPMPAGLFDVDASGTGRLVVRASEPVGNFDQAGITIEPAGGSAVPNLDALVFAGPIK